MTDDETVNFDLVPPQRVLDAFRRQESGGRADARSVQNARGTLQITEPLFKDYAYKGENFNSSADVEAVAHRAFNAVYARHGGDLGRTAVEWFSGRGNVAGPDSPVPYKSASRSDALGTRTDTYVRNIERLTARGGPAPSAKLVTPAQAAAVDFSDLIPKAPAATAVPSLPPRPVPRPGEGVAAAGLPGPPLMEIPTGSETIASTPLSTGPVPMAPGGQMPPAALGTGPVPRPEDLVRGGMPLALAAQQAAPAGPPGPPVFSAAPPMAGGGQMPMPPPREAREGGPVPASELTPAGQRIVGRITGAAGQALATPTVLAPSKEGLGALNEMFGPIIAGAAQVLNSTPDLLLRGLDALQRGGVAAVAAVAQELGLSPEQSRKMEADVNVAAQMIATTIPLARLTGVTTPRGVAAREMGAPPGPVPEVAPRAPEGRLPVPEEPYGSAAPSAGRDVYAREMETSTRPTLPIPPVRQPTAEPLPVPPVRAPAGYPGAGVFDEPSLRPTLPIPKVKPPSTTGPLADKIGNHQQVVLDRIDPSTPAAPVNTVAMLQKVLPDTQAGAELQGAAKASPLGRELAALDRDIRNSPDGQLPVSRLLSTLDHVDAAIQSGGLVDGAPVTKLAEARTAIAADAGPVIRQQAGPQVAAIFEQEGKFQQAAITTAKATTTPRLQEVHAVMQRAMAGQAKPGELAAAIKPLQQKHRDELRAAFERGLGYDGDKWSLDKFLGDWNAADKTARNLLYMDREKLVGFNALAEKLNAGDGLVGKVRDALNGLDSAEGTKLMRNKGFVKWAAQATNAKQLRDKMEGMHTDARSKAILTKFLGKLDEAPAKPVLAKPKTLAAKARAKKATDLSPMPKAKPRVRPRALKVRSG